MGVRRAEDGDVETLLELAARKREQYRSYSPLFWRPAAAAVDAQRGYFKRLIGQPDWICLVHEGSDGIDGFIMAQLVDAPPVYDPGGKACIIDDFVVTDHAVWPSIGIQLKREAERIAFDAGASISVTVCGRSDTEKREALLQSGTHIASEWHVVELEPAVLTL
jgi:hypothetical protein